MTYESAPATVLLATHCACCGRPLLDADSVQIGMGPTCRKRHGYTAGPSERRPEANRAIHKIACLAHQPGRDAATATEIVKALAMLRTIGFEKCADHLTETIATVKITEANGVLTVVTPYSEAAVEDMRRIPGRRWNREAKANAVPRSSGAALLEALCRHYFGAIGVGPKGLFVVGHAAMDVAVPVPVAAEPDSVVDARYGVITREQADRMRPLVGDENDDGTAADIVARYDTQRRVGGAL